MNLRGTRKLFKVEAIVNNKSNIYYLPQSTINTDKMKLSIRNFMNTYYELFYGKSNKDFNGIQVDLMSIKQITPIHDIDQCTFFIDE
jgi:hypothetical protein